MLRYKSDIRSIAYILVISTILFILYQHEGLLDSKWIISLWIFQLIMSISVGVMIHNHKHLPMWKGKFLNIITDSWLTVLYGFPVFGWIPTHLQNHHIHTNKEEDYTKTYSFSEKNNLFNLIIYPMYSGGVQQKAIVSYMKSLFKKDRTKFWSSMIQVVILVAFMSIMFILDWRKAIFYVIIPQQIALTSVLIFNYVQHIHADEESEYNHSRNITGWVLNSFLFNNGLHTAHHLKPNLHWSKIPSFHKEIEHKINSVLNEKSILWFLTKQYILSPVVKKFGTISMREERMREMEKVG